MHTAICMDFGKRKSAKFMLLFGQDLAFTAKSVRKRTGCK